MARKPAMTEAALVALGADKLAKLVLDEAEQNPVSSGLSRLLLLAPRVHRRSWQSYVVASPPSSGRAGFIDWQKAKGVHRRPEATVAAITRELGPADPAAATEQLVRFLTTADAVFERVDDSSGQVQSVYWDAVDALPGLPSNSSPRRRRPWASNSCRVCLLTAMA
jgi:hypothetical protein